MSKQWTPTRGNQHRTFDHGATKYSNALKAGSQQSAMMIYEQTITQQPSNELDQETSLLHELPMQLPTS
jgi:hypothetical protein